MLSVMASISYVHVLLMIDFNCRNGALQDHEQTENVTFLEEFEHILIVS